MKIIDQIQNTSFVKLIVKYVAIMIAIFVLSIFAFFFPILPIYYLLGKEFSNLGPIATGVWGAIIDIFVITPAFIAVIIMKIVMVVSNRNDK